MEKSDAELFDAILRNTAEAPFNYDAYHEFLNEKGCEQEAEFLADAVSYQSLAYNFFTESIPGSNLDQMLGSPEKIPFPKKPKSLQFDKYEEFLILVKQQWIELCETYILPGSPRQIAIPAADAKAIEELMDMGHFHPDILSEIYFGIYDRLFQEFQSFVERQKLLATFESESSRRNSTQLKDELSLSTPITAKVAPNENSDADLSQGRPAKKLSIVSNRSASGNGARKVLAVVTNASANSNTLISPPGLHTATPLPEISFEQVISNTAPSPFSRKDYLEYLESLRSEENLEFLIEVLAYRKLAEKFYQPANAFKNTMEMHEQASSLPQATKPAELDEAKYLVEFNALKIIAIDLVDNFLKPSAPKEVNLPSKVQKPLIMLSESGHYNPEVFAEAYSHIYDMLHQNEFVKFLKHALILSSPISSEGAKKTTVSARPSTARQSSTENRSEEKHPPNRQKVLASGRSAAVTKKRSKLSTPSSAENSINSNLKSISGSHSSLSDEEESHNESLKGEKKVLPSGRSAQAKKINTNSQSKTSMSNSNYSDSIQSGIDHSDSIAPVKRHSRSANNSKDKQEHLNELGKAVSRMRMSNRALSDESVSHSSSESVDVNESDRPKPKIIPSGRSAAAGQSTTTSPPPRSPEVVEVTEEKALPKVIASSRTAAVPMVNRPVHQPHFAEIPEHGDDLEQSVAQKVIASGRSATAPLAATRIAQPAAPPAPTEAQDNVEVEERVLSTKVIASGRAAAVPSGRSAVAASSRSAAAPHQGGRAAVPRSAQGGRSAAAAAPSYAPAPQAVVDGEEGSKEKKGMFGFAKKK